MEEEFEEEEIWAMAREVEDRPKTIKPKDASFSSCSTAIITPSSFRKIRRSTTLGEESSKSAPIIIPNWSKMHRRSCSVNVGVAQVGGIGGNEDEDEEEGMLPPHEWVAKKLVRCQISSSSVCEGAGRTLKGRDQCKVRDAVLTKTGFL
ncbi:hypothetical protein HPP92_012405 [Vanilla planifolia]|uniref:Senescence regulator n=1 Tax=Vanilla planifolia TaxID=51239 RepID=A0A835R7N8_VANPL|nr:hypothetical protein HPP92_012405 [Vanilla planifolia]